MTTPAPSPGTAKRSKRLYIYWGAALALLLGLGLFSWLVVVPVLETRAVVRITYDCQPSTSKPKGEIYPKEAVKRLGGRAAAESKLQMYLRLPDWIAPNKYRARSLLDMMRTGQLIGGQ